LGVSENSNQNSLNYESIYDGMWNEGIEEGHGRLSNRIKLIVTLVKRNGEIYEGMFSRGKFNGKGTMMKKDGSIIIGTWIDNFLYEGE
jgi:hypothetical protein